MKKSRFWLIGLVITAGLVATDTPIPLTGDDNSESRVSVIKRIKDSTVALVTDDKDVGIKPYCSGVWVADDVILTAHHCIEDKIVVLHMVHDDMEHTGVSLAMDCDPDNDLALLRVITANNMPHPVVKIADSAWQGQRVHIMGHPAGLWWTYIEGLMSSYREKGFFNTRFPNAYQISSATWFGNSGGGAFDEQGNLLGISSWISNVTPQLSFYIPRTAIQEFLKKNEIGQ